jgi:hypothetical protein
MTSFVRGSGGGTYGLKLVVTSTPVVLVMLSAASWKGRATWVR